MGHQNAILVYNANKNDINSLAIWNNCYDYQETLTLIKTDHNTIIGVYCPTRIENTSEYKLDEEFFEEGWKECLGANPIFFYF